MKQQKGFDWFKLATTAMFVTGIGLCLFSIFSWIVFRESLSTNAIKVNLDVPPVSSIGNKAQYLQNDPLSEWGVSIYQDTTTQEDTTQINEVLPQFESLNSDLLSEFEDVVFDDIAQTDEFGQTPEELEQIAANVLQKLNAVRSIQ